MEGVGERLLGVHVVHETDLERLLRGQESAGDHQVERAGRSDEPGEPLRAARSGEDAQGDLG